MIKRILKPFFIILIITLILETFIFNMDFWLSRLDGKPVSYKFTTTLGESDKDPKSDYYIVNKAMTVTALTEGPAVDLNYLWLDYECVDKDGTAVQCNVTVAITDEGNCNFYTLPKTTMYSDIAESQFIPVNSYGDVIKLKVSIDPDISADTYFKINKIVFNPDVPMFSSWVRVIITILGLSMLWAIRPASSLYKFKFKSSNRRNITLAVCAANILLFVVLICFNTGFYNPGWTHHKQYHKLAVALTHGEVSITTGYEDMVDSLTNPYDTNLRKTYMTEGYWSVWDLAFYEGKFYVYFGIVPVLIFYLPFYLITGKAFPTNAGIFIMAVLTLIGVFYLMHHIIRRYFKRTPFILYLTLSLIVGNSIGTIPILMRPDFYSLPIMCALAFTIWGLGLWMSAASLWKAELSTTGNIRSGSASRINKRVLLRLMAGSLFMALVAGCRPQFLVGSFFIFFIFGECIIKSWRPADESHIKTTRRTLILRTILALLPYIVVAVGLMYYNYIRFGSPVDFGANYNLTTNDMTKRGLNLDRFTDGVWMYLFQPPNIGMKFPYVYSTAFNSDYMGTTIRENMFGGAFFTQIITLSLLGIVLVKNKLKEKKLLGFTITSVVFALIVVGADTQMAGILSRYYYDFLWLLLIPACIVIMQLWESYKDTEFRRVLIGFIMVSLVVGFFMNFFIGFQASNITSYNDYIYNFVRYIFN